MGRTSTLGGPGSRSTSEQRRLDDEFDASQEDICPECEVVKEWCQCPEGWPDNLPV